MAARSCCSTLALLGAGGYLAARLLMPLRRSPSDQQIARYVEEKCPELDDLLVTAAQKLDSPQRGMLDGLMLGSAATRASEIERERIIDPVVVREARARGGRGARRVRGGARDVARAWLAGVPDDPDVRGAAGVDAARHCPAMRARRRAFR